MTDNQREIEQFLLTNDLFKGFKTDQIFLISSLCKEVTFQPNEVIIKENEISDQIFIVKEGEVEVYKWDETVQQNHHIVNIGKNQVIGELSLLDNIPRSASVKAITPTTLIEFSVSNLKNLPKDMGFMDKFLHKFSLKKENNYYESPIYSNLIKNLGRSLSLRIRTTNEAIVESLRKELEFTKMRVIMGNFIITIISLLIIYLITLTLVIENQTFFANSVVVSGPLIALFAIIVFFYMLKTGIPLSHFGLNLNNWQNSLKESLIVVILFLGVIVLAKYWVIHYYPITYKSQLIFEGGLVTKYFSDKIFLLDVLIYVLLVPLQEFLVRGALQTSFLDFLVSPNRRFWSILMSNLLFATTHFHISILFGFLAFLSGLVWGYLYSRNRTLLGVTLSHEIVGIFGLFIVNFQGSEF